MKLTTHLHPAPTLRMSAAIPPLPNCLHGMHKDNFTFTLPAVIYGYSKNVFEQSGKENLELRGY